MCLIKNFQTRKQYNTMEIIGILLHHDLKFPNIKIIINYKL